VFFGVTDIFAAETASQELLLPDDCPAGHTGQGWSLFLSLQFLA
jgi:hypothetical protein